MRAPRPLSLICGALICAGFSILGANAAVDIFLKLEMSGQPSMERIPALGFRADAPARMDSMTGTVTSKHHDMQTQREASSGMATGKQAAVKSPRDAASGMPTGKRMHKPFVIVKQIDKATPLLAKALTSNETIPSVEIMFVGDVDGDGRPDSHAVRMSNVSVVAIQPGMGQAGSMRTEEIAFSYSKLEIDGKDATGEDVMKRTFIAPHVLERSSSSSTR